MSGSMRTTWYRRNLLRLPVPAERNAEFLGGLTELGMTLFALDNELIANRKFLVRIGLTKPHSARLG
jgi:hypothetical protein